jgi:hypothetical protein
MNVKPIDIFLYLKLNNRFTYKVFFIAVFWLTDFKTKVQQIYTVLI